jgi:hypothetical protein
MNHNNTSAGGALTLVDNNTFVGAGGTADQHPALRRLRGEGRPFCFNTART